MISQEGINDVESINKLSENINQGFQTKLLSGISLSTKALVLTAIIVVAMVSSAFFMFALDSGGEVALTIPGVTPTISSMAGNEEVKRKVCSVCDGDGKVGLSFMWRSWYKRNFNSDIVSRLH